MRIMDLFKSKFTRWVESASDEELAAGYELLRQNWLKNGGGDKTPQMERINNEITRRMNEKHRREHPNAEPRYREHGWYLFNDD